MRNLILLAAAVLAAQDEGARIVAAMKTILEAGKTKEAVSFLDHERSRAALAAHPKALADIASEAGDDASVLAASSRDEARKLGDLLESLAEAAVAAAPEKADSHWAVGEAKVAAGRLALAAGEKDVPADRWIAAVDALEKAYEADSREGMALACAAEAAMEGAGRTGADGAALVARATALMGRALEKHPDSTPVLKSATFLDIARCRRLLDAKDKAGADAALAAALARLAPHLKGASTDVEIATGHNAAVSFLKANAKELKKAKGEFLAAPGRVAGVLDLQIPLGRLWSTDGEKTTVFQFTPEFEALRSFSFSTYDWDTEWQLGDGSKVGGDNLSGLAGNEYAIAVRTMKKVISKRAPAKARLNRWVDDGYYYEVQGIDADGDYSFARTWFFKCKGGHLTTIRLTMYDFKEGKGPDAGAQLVLDSIKEAPKK